MGEVPMVEEIIERLRLLARVGVATEGALGISIPYLRALGKSLGRNHLLALAL
jgi:3-methyladenine DNA glycosylase AlkD